ncbi:2-oxoacid:ferredoxin oxidoreductase subunit beta [Halobacteriovorax marinus]|uniref:2-oxoacid:ferredoxin oxidoreductase subunit beta n=1 Tax=Halobacteriovorax marinus TaxID=97084 RepID=A0A1Y5FC68_9BACT|nr:2-oxoacid:ferredoxin oxidoreductase subunit beta [Halobacteriovorax marinus]
MSDKNYNKKDFTSDQDVKWCPGCGDYSVLSSLQLALTKTGKKKEDIVCVSGIGCSSRFPYYMGIYGYHTIHGRAPAFATGIKVANPNLSVWLITGDGDCLSIGGNHFIHLLRRNVNINLLLFNNEIYGLTKGQYSPTSKTGIVTKSTPFGSLDRNFNPGLLAFGAGATFISKTLDTDPKHMMETFKEADQHEGISFVEVYQNCVIFNDGCHDEYTNRKSRDDNAIFLRHGDPMIFGKEREKGIIFKDMKLHIVRIGSEYKEEDLLIHDKTNRNQSYLLLAANEESAMPKFYGVVLQEEVVTFDQQVEIQIKEVTLKKGKGDFKELLNSGETWVIE